MTLEELSLKYSWEELSKIPGDADFRFKTLSPILQNIYENKILYYERFMCVAVLEDIKITPERFEARAVPLIELKRLGSTPDGYYPEKPWTFGASWPHMAVQNGYFTTYGGMWIAWTDKELVKTVEELAKKGDLKTALNLTLYKGH